VNVTEYEAARTIEAPPELIFDVASDPAAMDEWLPHDVHVEPTDPPAVTVTHGAGADRDRALVRGDRDQLRVEWGTRDSDEYAGWLQVTGIETKPSEGRPPVVLRSRPCAAGPECRSGAERESGSPGREGRETRRVRRWMSRFSRADFTAPDGASARERDPAVPFGRSEWHGRIALFGK